MNFILNLLLIRYWKSIGASIATVIAECVVTSIQFYLVRREIRIHEVLKICYKYIIASILMFIVSIMVGYYISNNLISIIVQVTASVMVYFGTLIVMKDILICEGLEKVKRLFRRYRINN